MKKILMAVLSVFLLVGCSKPKSTESTDSTTKAEVAEQKSKESSEKKDSSETTQSENGLDEYGLPILTGKVKELLNDAKLFPLFNQKEYETINMSGAINELEDEKRITDFIVKTKVPTNYLLHVYLDGKVDVGDSYIRVNTFTPTDIIEDKSKTTTTEQILKSDVYEISTKHVFDENHKVSDQLDINIEYQIRKDGQTYLQWLGYEKLNLLEGNYKSYRYFVHTDAFDKVRKYSSITVDVFTDDNQMVTIWYISPFFDFGKFNKEDLTVFAEKIFEFVDIEKK